MLSSHSCCGKKLSIEASYANLGGIPITTTTNVANERARDVMK